MTEVREYAATPSSAATSSFTSDRLPWGGLLALSMAAFITIVTEAVDFR